MLYGCGTHVQNKMYQTFLYWVNMSMYHQGCWLLVRGRILEEIPSMGKLTRFYTEKRVNFPNGERQNQNAASHLPSDASESLQKISRIANDETHWLFH